MFPDKLTKRTQFCAPQRTALLNMIRRLVVRRPRRPRPANISCLVKRNASTHLSFQLFSVGGTHAGKAGRAEAKYDFAQVCKRNIEAACSLSPVRTWVRQPRTAKRGANGQPHNAWRRPILIDRPGQGGALSYLERASQRMRPRFLPQAAAIVFEIREALDHVPESRL